MQIHTIDGEIFVWENDRLLYFNKDKNDYDIFLKVIKNHCSVKFKHT